MNIEKVISILVAKSGLPGHGFMRVEKVEDGRAETRLICNIRVRTTGEAPIVQVQEMLSLPLPNEDGVFEVKGQNICLVRRAKMRTPGEVLTHIDQLTVGTLEETYSEIISIALNASMAPVRRGTGGFDKLLFETKLTAAFSSDEYARNLPAVYNKAAAKAWQDTVVLTGVTLDEKNPIPQGWEKVFDLTTTPQSDKVCTVYALADGARVDKGRLIAGDSYFSSTVKSGIFAPACAPTQMYKPHSTLKNFVRLINTEEPLVAHVGAERDLFHGVNLLTAIVHDEYNQMDQITISKSAADRLGGYVYMSEVVQVTSGGSNLLVKEGDTIEPNGILAEVISPEGMAEVRARRLVRPAVIHQIESFRRTQNGITGIQHRIILRSSAPLVSGDKLMPRSGCKGCVVVVPDDHLPEVQMRDGSWRRAELAINPFPVAKRKNLSILLEMACNEAGITEVPIDTTAIYLKHLYEKGYAKKRPARRGGVEYDEAILAGTVFWMRSDSLYEYRTYVAGEVKHNFQELNPDRGRNSGISYNPTMRILLSRDKQCPVLDKVLMLNNFNPNVGKLVKDLYSMINSRLTLKEESCGA